MPTTLINVGAAPNDNSGNTIRTAFQTVNTNFETINRALFSGTELSIINATAVTGIDISGNTITSNAFAANTAVINGNVTINGNLTVTGTQAAAGGTTTTSSPIQFLHSGNITSNDGKDIGTVWYHYKTSNLTAFLGWQNSSNSLVYMDTVSLSDNQITGGTFGNAQLGSLLISRSTASTSNVTGALQVVGGIGVQGNVFVQSNIFVGNNANVSNITVRGFHVGDLNFSGTDTVRINGQPVLTSGGSGFNGGNVNLATNFLSTTPSTSTGTGAVTIAGGLGVAGNAYFNNAFFGNIFVPLPGLIYGNLGTNAQPFITSLGELTTLTMAGPIAGQNIVPRTTLSHSLGTSTSSRWLKLWVYDIDYSNTLTGVSASFSGALSANSLSIASAFSAPNASFTSNITTGNISITSGLATNSSVTGALTVSGGAGISGNLNVGRSIGFTNGGQAFRIGINSTGQFEFVPNIVPGNPGDPVLLIDDDGAGIFISTRFFANANTSSNSTSTGSIVTQGGLGVAENINAGGSVSVTGNIITTSVTTSTSTSTGALKVSGGAGIAGNVYTNAVYTTTGLYWAANGSQITTAIRSSSAGTTSGTITPTAGTADHYNILGLTGGITVAAPSGTPSDGQKLVLRIRDNGIARSISWTTTSGGYRAIGVSLPTTTIAGKLVYVGCVYNSTDTFWDVIAVTQET
jgi:hypothetical protein